MGAPTGLGRLGDLMSDNLSHLLNQRVPPPPAPPRRTPFIPVVDRSVWLLGKMLPYALVALVLRLLMARAFFLAGQSKIEGPSVPLDVLGLEWSVTLPMAVRETTVQAFERMTNLPIPAWIAAPVVSYAEFILPICLLLGLATRFAALALLIMIVTIQVFVAPEALSTHVYGASILLVLISLGPGVVSIDHGIRRLHDGPLDE
jgi:putative oxidoreductase